MRPPLYLTGILALALAALGWHNHRRIDALRGKQDRAVALAAEGGWLVDERAPDGLVKLASAPRPDRAAEAKLAAAALIAYARELPFPEDLSAEEKCRRVAVETERIQQLDGSQLKILVAELRDTPVDPDTRDSLLCFALGQLALTHPRDALEILLELPYRSCITDLQPEIVLAWAKTDPAAAQAWLAENRGRVAENQRAAVERALREGAVIGDPRLALRLLGESGNNSLELRGCLDREELTAAHRLALLTALRERATVSGTAPIADRDERATCMRTLIFGRLADRPASFAVVSSFLEEAKLEPQELDCLTVCDLPSEINPQEAVLWFEWIGKNFPAKHAARWQSHLMREPRTATPIQDWLAAQPADVRQRLTPEEGAAPAIPAGKQDYPVAKAIPGKPGFVLSPYTNKIIDVREMPPGTLVRDPEHKAVFRLP